MEWWNAGAVGALDAEWVMLSEPLAFHHSNIPALNSLDAQFSLNGELFHSLSQRSPGYAQQLGRLDLIAVHFFECLNNQLAFDSGNDLELWVAARPLK